MYQFDKYRKFLLNRVSSNQDVVEYIENNLITEDDSGKHSFHKIMVCRWPDNDIQLFEALSEYTGVTFIPLGYEEKPLLTSFHTNSLMLVIKILKADFMFPHHGNMFSLDIFLNDKTSLDCFQEKMTIDDIICHTVSHRFNQFRELNLSDFCNDPVFKEKKIRFYKLSLLAYFKILMIRMGRDTKILNLSSNNLSQVPLDILNFFIRGDLIGVNLSNNNIPSVSELQRISSKIEKLWVEGNPLCEGVESICYIKTIAQKFPRLTELDGVNLNEHGIMMPFYKYYMVTPDKKTNMVIERFVSLYFSHFDTNRLKVITFYDPTAHMTLSTDFPETREDLTKDPYVMHSRNFLNPVKPNPIREKKKKLYKKSAIINVLTSLPETIHDLNSFNIDVLKHDNRCLMFIIDGVYKEKVTQRVIQFRRTFILCVNYKVNNNTLLLYTIVNEMISISLASPEIVKNSFQKPIRNMNQLTLIDPDSEDQETMCNVFIHYTQLKKFEAEARLVHHNWDIKTAIKKFTKDLKSNNVSSDKFMDDDFSDVSSLLEDEID